MEEDMPTTTPRGLERGLARSSPARGARRASLLLLAAALAAGAATAIGGRAAHAQSESGALRVGIKEAPPFAIRGEDGAWSGIAVELWEEVAKELGLSFSFVERDLEELLAETAAGRLDVAVGALTVTADREERIDFTHPFHTSGLGVAVAPAGREGILGTLRRAVTWDFARALGALLAVLLLAGLLVWLFERRRNAGQFGGAPAEGIGAGFWWAAVTMTTVATATRRR
jgi:polar amino acid transport system substrate-binding protein